MDSALICRYLLILFVTSSSTVILAQHNLEEKSYYNWFDQNIGHENTALFNGELYSKTYRTEDNNHNFLIGNEYVTGEIEFNNQKYYDISLKYDIYNDELIVKLENSFGRDSYVQLNKIFIKTFSVYNKNFKSLNAVTENITVSGFYEISHSGSIVSLYTKHYKFKEEYIIEKLLYDKFSKKDKNILFFNDSYYEVNSKKDLKKIFPEQKKQINTFYKKNKSLKKSDNNAFIRAIVQQIEQSI